MKTNPTILLALWLAGTAPAAVAADNAAIPQVSGQASDDEHAEPESGILQEAPADGAKKDYQKQILADPKISDIGRANALTGGGGNTAVITQKGSSNRSTVRQSGKNNYARQTQEGRANDLYLDQQGEHNRSRERQTGAYNHKVIIQNKDRKETTEQDDE